MRKVKITFKLIPLVTILTVLMFSGCEENNTNDFKDFLGTWVSRDMSDTLNFRSDHDLYSNSDYYVYSLSRDSITIRYDGKLFILVSPTTHFYKLNGNTLTIDFRPYCYGFKSEVIEYSRK
jgi:hypothetical protein